jgi:hypothetical protein
MYGYRISGGEEVIRTDLIQRPRRALDNPVLTVRWLPGFNRYELLGGLVQYEDAIADGVRYLNCIVIGQDNLDDVAIERSVDEINQEPED